MDGKRKLKPAFRYQEIPSPYSAWNTTTLSWMNSCCQPTGCGADVNDLSLAARTIPPVSIPSATCIFSSDSCCVRRFPDDGVLRTLPSAMSTSKAAVAAG